MFRLIIANVYGIMLFSLFSPSSANVMNPDPIQNPIIWMVYCFIGGATMVPIDTAILLEYNHVNYLKSPKQTEKKNQRNAIYAAFVATNLIGIYCIVCFLLQGDTLPLEMWYLGNWYLPAPLVVKYFYSNGTTSSFAFFAGGCLFYLIGIGMDALFCRWVGDNTTEFLDLFAAPTAVVGGTAFAFLGILVQLVEHKKNLSTNSKKLS